MNIRELPKIDLHCHLDGSLTKAFIRKHYDYEITDEMLRAPEDCPSLAVYLEKFDLPIACLQTAEDLEEGAYTFMESLFEDGVEYVEARFAPSFHTNAGLSLQQVVDAVKAGMERGKKEFGISYGIICCAMRHLDLESNRKVLQLVKENLGKGVVAFDLAGSEAVFPNNLFFDLFKEAKELEVPYTIHSGEQGSLENVKDAYDMDARRIGHGISLIQDRELMKIYADAGIGVEMCPTSNFQTKAVNDWSEYPLKEFVDAGILVSINTDNRTVSGTNLTKELELVYNQYGQDEELILKLVENAKKIAFAYKK
ncbi:MAG: adenosine deaminase [Dorea sp.]|nr:adenosine deaminase [Dorea sp.]